MEKLNEKQINDKSVEVFKAHPDCDTLFATEDGQFFKAEHFARSHAGSNGLKWFEVKKPKSAPKKEKKATSKKDQKETEK